MNYQCLSKEEREEILRKVDAGLMLWPFKGPLPVSIERGMARRMNQRSSEQQAISSARGEDPLFDMLPKSQQERMIRIHVDRNKKGFQF